MPKSGEIPSLPDTPVTLVSSTMDDDMEKYLNNASAERRHKEVSFGIKDGKFLFRAGLM